MSTHSWLWLPELISVVLLGIICLQDWRSRSVSLWLFPALFIGAVASIGFRYPWQQWLGNWGNNLLFLLAQLLLLHGYYAIRQRKFVYLLDGMVGWGDVLCWIILALYFSLANFIIFFLSSLLFSLVLHLLLIPVIHSNNRGRVPLAGWQSAYLGLLLLIRWLFFPQWDFCQEDWLVNWMLQ